MPELVKCAAAVWRAGRILAICHVAPDGDAIGSLLGFGWLVRGLAARDQVLATARSKDGDCERVEDPVPFGTESSREVVLVCADAVPAELAFLPGSTGILTTPPPGPWDLVIALDASDLRRLGRAFPTDLPAATPIVNIDHHVTNLRFGDLNCVDPSAAATAQMVVALADALEETHPAVGTQAGVAPSKPVHLPPEAAVCLLTGLVTDTLGFRTTNVTPKVLATAIRLMEAGANLAEITTLTLNRKPVGMMRLWGLALSTLRVEHRVVWAEVTQQMRLQAGAPETGESGLSSFLMGAPEADIAAVFAERPDGQVEVSFRARSDYDISGIALELGGGGHPQASGCILPGSLATVEERVLPLLFAKSRCCSDDATTSQPH